MVFYGVSRNCSHMTKISPVLIWRRNIYGRLGFNFDFFWPRDPRTEISLPKILLHSKTNWKLKKSFYSQLAYVCQDMQLFSHKDTTDFYHLVKSLTISVAHIGKIHPTNQIQVRGWTSDVLRPLLVIYQFWSLFGSFNFPES